MKGKITEDEKTASLKMYMMKKQHLYKIQEINVLGDDALIS